MSTKSHNTPLARLSRIGLALGIGSTHKARDYNSKGEDDSYIPYNGPYESPTKGQEIRGYWDSGAQDVAHDTPSISHLSFNEERVHTPYNQTSSISNGRKYTDASRATLSNIVTEPRRRFGRIRQNSTPPPRTSYVSLNQGGGVADTPIPVHRSTPSQSGSSKRRDSVFRASVTDLRKSFSRNDDRHEKTRPSGASTDDHVPSALSSPSIYEQTSRRSRSNSVTMQQRHPYATATPYLGKTSPLQINPRSQKSEHVKPPQKKVPAHLKPSSRASLLKASVSTPDLRSTSRVKTKTHWLSAETWCDAFMFPRPRFLLRHLEGDPITPKRRLVSPAESIIPEQIEASAEAKPLKKSQSMSELRTSNFAKVVPSRAERNDAPPSATRPRSFALDDLALPSPIPSLITALADRQNLQNERQMWRECAAKSLGNRRTRSLSRSKSLGKTQKPSYRQPPAGTFDFLAERTLLGHQAVPSVVHTTVNPFTVPTQSVSRGSQAIRSFGSTFSRLRSKSHGHSNSAGTILDGPGHRRKGSISSVLRRAESTAIGPRVGVDGTSTPPDLLDTFTEQDGTKVITLSDRLWGATSPQRVVLISPTTYQNRTSLDRDLLVPSHQRLGISPTPSNQTQSAEGVGIAISSPRPSVEYPNDEPIILLAHPYAQGANSHHRASVTMAPPPETMHHRQPIVHPYAIHSVHPATLSPQWVHREQAVSPARRMFAEIAPGHLREIRSEEIQYSPYTEDAPRVFTTARAVNRPVVVERQSPNPPSRRDSDILRMGDALNSSLVRNRMSSSTDSGIGASEDPHPYGPQPERAASSRSNTFPLPQVDELLSAVDEDRDEGPSHIQRLEPPTILPQSDSNDSDPMSQRTTSSGQINPPVFFGTPTPVRRIESSGSSPGLSNDSSPPLTPRPLGRLDDLERFQDLFYNPSANRPRSPELPPVTVPATESEDWRSATGPVSLTRSRSQLTTLVRQLSEDLYELRNEEPIPEDDGRLEGPNAKQSRETLVGRSSSNGSPSVLGTTHPFLSTLSPQHPLDQPVVSSRQNFPEDVESDASSLSDRIPEYYDEITETLRLGSVEAVSTPPPINSPRRESGHVTLVDDSMSPAARVISSSSLTLPSTGPTRSSYLTIDSGGSRISGLSAFPRPPSEHSTDILASYFVQEADDDDMPELISAALQSPTSTTAENQGEWTHAL
ncbi:hypothetical protein BDM02DRAFT_3187132 [Thelephora ganbajun]|uniref:Uncharacterized protein n=1 Tax=Thelephora ganbajun TaxID=370292 RepID=A0ACB6ZFD8_THEGA|nr:hypothetical protein BDM02DRAFT_3187132 [Thelephora ganbajun]